MIVRNHKINQHFRTFFFTNIVIYFINLFFNKIYLCDSNIFRFQRFTAVSQVSNHLQGEITDRSSLGARSPRRFHVTDGIVRGLLTSVPPDIVNLMCLRLSACNRHRGIGVWQEIYHSSQRSQLKAAAMLIEICSFISVNHLNYIAAKLYFGDTIFIFY